MDDKNEIDNPVIIRAVGTGYNIYFSSDPTPANITITKVS